MISNYGRFLLALPAAALLFAAPAGAQSYRATVSEQALPPLTSDTRNTLGDDAPRPTGSIPQSGTANGRYFPSDDEADALPPPGLPSRDTAPAYVHQLDPNSAPTSYQSAPASPPAAIAPTSAPVASQPPAQSADAVPGSSVMTLPPEDQPETGTPKELPSNLKRQLVDFKTKEPAGTIIVDTPNTYLYLVLGHGKALRYGIGVGREGFTWSGTERISRMKEWPDWFPPPEMIERQPYLPRMMAGGPGNPLGARALYLGHTLYRIHGTNQPSTIGKTVSSGCIRLLNEDIEDLYSRVQVGTRVVVLPGTTPATASAENVASSLAPATADATAGHRVSTGSNLPSAR